MKLPVWQEFESLFLAPEEKTVDIRNLHHKYQRELGEYDDSLEDGTLSNEEYEELYSYAFNFWTEGKYSLLGSLEEVFTYELGDAFECLVDWNTFEEGDFFLIAYQGETAECISVFSDDDRYVDGMMTLTLLLYDAGLVLRVPANMDASDGFEFTIIPLDVWNRGIEKFGLKELRTKFIDFKEYYFGEVPVEFKQLYYTDLPKIEKLNINNASIEGGASSTKNIHAKEPSRESMGATILKWLGFSPKNQ